MAEEEKSEAIIPELPLGRVKKLVKLDRDINKVNSEALFLISCSTELFLRFFAEQSAEIAIQKKRRTVKLEHLRIAAKKHRPTRDFLLDSLPVPSQPSDRPPADRIRPQPAAEKPLPAGTRRIDDFFRKPEKEKPSEVNDS
ncbi:DNA polymerase epsilon subunit C [Vitis riparia]|uniref:DNA polymerase epsilon subunit C n=1 Tax=Vitis riparia TaxID=96939 RepID=UPI00155A1BFF|nr:DNA polymerase epsilon subunit C [Vitis riparia]